MSHTNNPREIRESLGALGASIIWIAPQDAKSIPTELEEVVNRLLSGILVCVDRAFDNPPMSALRPMTTLDALQKAVEVYPLTWGEEQDLDPVTDLNSAEILKIECSCGILVLTATEELLSKFQAMPDGGKLLLKKLGRLLHSITKKLCVSLMGLTYKPLDTFLKDLAVQLEAQVGITGY